MRARALLLVTLLATAYLPAAGGGALTPAERAILRKVSSRDLRVREEGQRELAAAPAMLRNPAVGRALARVVAEDTQRFRAAYLGKTPELGEGLAELDTQLSVIIDKAFDFRDPYILRVQAFSGYVPQSKFAYEIAGQGARALSIVLDLSRDSLSPSRADAAGVLGFMLERQREGTIKHRLSPAQATTALAALVAAARDPSVDVRSAAVWGLEYGGTPAQIPLLRRVAASDPTCPQMPRRWGTVCGLAERSIRAIERRAAAKRRGPVE